MPPRAAARSGDRRRRGMPRPGAAAGRSRARLPCLPEQRPLPQGDPEARPAPLSRPGIDPMSRRSSPSPSPVCAEVPRAASRRRKRLHGTLAAEDRPFVRHQSGPSRRLQRDPASRRGAVHDEEEQIGAPDGVARPAGPPRRNPEGPGRREHPRRTQFTSISAGGTSGGPGMSETIPRPPGSVEERRLPGGRRGGRGPFVRPHLAGRGFGTANVVESPRTGRSIATATDGKLDVPGRRNRRRLGVRAGVEDRAFDGGKAAEVASRLAQGGAAIGVVLGGNEQLDGFPHCARARVEAAVQGKARSVITGPGGTGAALRRPRVRRSISGAGR